MKLKSLLKNVDYIKLINFKNINITNLSIKSNEIINHGLFFAIKGNNFDGANFVDEAITYGAKAIVTEKELNNISCPQIVVKDIRKVMSIMAKTFYNNSDEKLKIITVVGTNGKTTTATVIYKILQEWGRKVGFIGTNGVYIGDLCLPSNFTTPDPIELHYTFQQMLAFQVEYVVMEVSAQSIYYDKVFGINPILAIFTNISNEHLDFFKTMENYSNVKLNYLSGCDCPVIINIDDEYGRKLAKMCKKPITYGLFSPADIFGVDITMTMEKMKFICNACDNILNIETSLVGEYNVYNLMASIGAMVKLGVDNLTICKAIKKINKVDGRWEVFEFPNNNKVIVDYAHTPDGFEKVLNTVKHFRHGRIITLFGCVGYSDSEKRRQMGNIVKKYSDFSIVTSDNYSDEKFDEIFNDIGISKYYAKIQNRAKAVEFGMDMLDKNDTLLLLGKGAEKTIKASSGEKPYSDIDTIKKFLGKNEKF